MPFGKGGLSDVAALSGSKHGGILTGEGSSEQCSHVLS